MLLQTVDSAGNKMRIPLPYPMQFHYISIHYRCMKDIDLLMDLKEIVGTLIIRYLSHQ
jgi:hypothetical protein